MRVLVFGFAEFAGISRNPSRLLVEQLPDIPGVDLARLVLPVEYGRANDQLAKALAKPPDVIVGFGVWRGIPAVRIEELAINRVDPTRTDNSGYTPLTSEVRPGAPAAHATSIPTDTLVALLRKNGYPAIASLTPTAYLCNFAYFIALDWAHSANQHARVIFVHVPMATEDVLDDENPPPSLPMALLRRAAIDIIMDCLHAPKEDPR